MMLIGNLILRIKFKYKLFFMFKLNCNIEYVGIYNRDGF